MGFLVIVRRDEPQLFEYLQKHFEEPEVSVLMDRRYGERRRRQDGEGPERRRQDRRATPVQEDPLWKFGFRVVAGSPAI
jgi:hypothetical protein